MFPLLSVACSRTAPNAFRLILNAYLAGAHIHAFSWSCKERVFQNEWAIFRIHKTDYKKTISQALLRKSPVKIQSSKGQHSEKLLCDIV
ncbi:unnamed protein product [Acanthoscelides obtectus]|uniref:Uncharacterized protein n=1 Tax=Acanthoscelides obtectus TaxID=200917 RepID=A0A9P0KR30_ACAOB|nr:unnamed protein product [Acanthoscelides obtectus]CAK1655848.1 hypothetical protein AOBTE_LOCUS19386 [Acanthoscelides obtectus]